MPYALEQHTDLVRSVIHDIREDVYVDVQHSLQQHIALPHLMKQNRRIFESGDQHQFQINTTGVNQARMVQIGESDNPTDSDTLVQALVPMRYADANWTLDQRVVDANSGANRILNLVKHRETNALTSLFTLFETQFWEKPTGTTDVRSLFGVKYWITRNIQGAATLATQGFNGGDPQSQPTTGRASVSTATVPNWVNYTDQYTLATPSDLITKVRLASYKTNFRPPVDYPSLVGDKSGGDGQSYYGGAQHPYGYYTAYTIVAQLEELLRSRNDNLGTDLAEYDGRVMFQRKPIVPVPYIDANDTATGTGNGNTPFYGFNWDTWKILVQEGWWFRKTRIENHPFRHNEWVRWVDMGCNILCYDLRRNFVLFIAT